MFIRITEKVLSNMEKQNMIQTDQRSVYMYGINQMLNILLNILTYLVIGLIFHMTLETIIFTCAYIPLRIYAGGFHAKTPFRCWITSGLMLFAVLFFMKYVSLNAFEYDIIAVVCAVIILILSPVEDKNKPLDDKEKPIYKIRSIIVFSAELIIVFLLKLFHNDSIVLCIEMVWITLCTMLAAGKFKNYLIIKGEQYK